MTMKTASQAVVASETPLRFAPERVLPFALMDEITEIRIHRPGLIEQEARRRKRRSRLTRDGKLVLAALDHPARGVTRVGNQELAMADRHQLLARTRRVLEDRTLDGVLVTSDELDELLILSHLERQRSGKSFLDGRVLLGSMNRGGLSAAVFEMEDTFTALTAGRLKALRCDGGKMLCRLDPQDAASGRTLVACAQAVNALQQHGLPAFIEPLVVARDGNGYKTLNDANSVARMCGIASALGESSAHVWLKLPYVENFVAVCRSTTLPILLLGGPARESPSDTLKDFASALNTSSRVRGAVIGRNLLFPGEADPLPMCKALTAIVHQGVTLDEAVRISKTLAA
jgi:hypothetical protein